MRRVGLCTLLVAVVALTMSACGSSDEPQKAAATGGTITVLTNTTLEPAMKKMITGFTNAHPGAKINATYAEGDAGAQTIVTRLRAGRGPDIFYVFAGAGNINSVQPLAKNGYVLDLSDRPWAKKLNAADRLGLSYNGKVYAAPSGTQGIVYVYNEQVMTPPAQWSQVIPFCKAARAKGKVAYAVGYQDQWPAIFIPYALGATLVNGPQPDNAEQVLNGQAKMVDSDWVKAVEMTEAMEKAGCFQDSPTGTSYDNAMGLVGKGDALGSVGVAVIADMIRQKAPAGTALRSAPFPATDDPNGTYLPAGPLQINAISAKTKNPELAKQFLDYMMDPAQLKLTGKLTGYVPPFPVAGFKPNVEAQPIIEYQEKDRTTPIVDQWWPNPKVQEALYVGVLDLAGGKSSARQVVTNMDEAFTP
jgi:raffinose/stachyose/melibiose transport system substrate-binding protein